MSSTVLCRFRGPLTEISRRKLLRDRHVCAVVMGLLGVDRLARWVLAARRLAVEWI